MMDLEYASVPVGDIKPHPRNVRSGNVDAIKDSLQAHGQYRPIVVQKSTGHVLAGNHTYMAAVELGWPEIEVSFVDVDDEQALRIMLVDNRTSDFGTYDDQGLSELLSMLDTLDGTGFDLDDLSDLRQLTQIRDVQAGEQGSGYSGAALSTDGIVPDKGFEGWAEGYASKAVRSIILAYQLDEFEEATRLLASARELTGTESNSDAVLAVLRDLA